MDAVFASANFRSEITWKRTSAHSDRAQGRRQHGRVRDALLYFTKGDSWTWNPVYTEYDRDYIDKSYRHVEPETGRRYRLDNLTGPGGAAKGNPQYELMGVTRYWRYSKERMQELVDSGRVVQTKPGSVPAYKRYLDEMPGVPLQDLWTDINPIASRSKERTGYPTQKPLALLERIIQASSNEVDMVLDPFCGCATACVAAEKLGRQWAGIDISPNALVQVNKRLRDELGLFSLTVTHRTDIPQRTDLGLIPPYKTQKHTLFGKFEGKCQGCLISFPFRNLTIDHVIPVSKGGTDHIDNLQLLCGACNSTKGAGTNEEFLVKLRAMGLR
jgi:DNA modification methylase